MINFTLKWIQYTSALSYRVTTHIVFVSIERVLKRKDVGQSIHKRKTSEANGQNIVCIQDEFSIVT